MLAPLDQLKLLTAPGELAMTHEYLSSKLKGFSTARNSKSCRGRRRDHRSCEGGRLYCTKKAGRAIFRKFDCSRSSLSLEEQQQHCDSYENIPKDLNHCGPNSLLLVTYKLLTEVIVRYITLLPVVGNSHTTEWSWPTNWRNLCCLQWRLSCVCSKRWCYAPHM